MQKTICHLLLAGTIIVTTASCGYHSAIVQNTNLNNTQVSLKKKNYTVTKRVSGSASTRYVLGFGGKKRVALLNEAQACLFDSAGLAGSAKAIANLTTEWHVKRNLFSSRRTVTVSGYVIEFTE